MNYALKVIKKLMEEKLGKRPTQQILCILLLIFGVKRKVIKKEIGASPTSLCKYEKLIREEKLLELFEAELYRPVSELEKHTDVIEEAFAKNPPKTRGEAAERIKRLTGVERALPNIGKFLKKRV
jgi:hypothetical protein